MIIIHILYLYPDLLNLYGDNGNIRILVKELSEQRDMKVSVDRKSVGDVIDWTRYDIVYCGAGIESNFKVALSDLKRYRDELSAYIEAKKPILMTGDSFQMLGNIVVLPNGDSIPGLCILDLKTSVSNVKRETKDAIYRFRQEPDKIAIGFINKSSQVELGDSVAPLFDVIYGIGNNPQPSGMQSEGVSYQGLMGTHLSGPLLVKNPWLLESICTRILSGYGIEYTPKISANQRKAYEISLDELQRVAAGK